MRVLPSRLDGRIMLRRWRTSIRRWSEHPEFTAAQSATGRGIARSERW